MAAMTSGFASLAEASRWYDAWLAEAALPLWSTTGVDPKSGAFLDSLTVAGAPVEAPLRARVQARQAFVFAEASARDPRLLEPARRGFGFFRDRFRLPDGRFAFRTDREGRVVDDRACLYEQDFALLAMAAFHRAGDATADWPAEARTLRDALDAIRHPAGGFREADDHPFQANAHMHLFETCMAWEAAGEADWAALSDEIAELALTRFIDADGGFLREFFDAGWRPAPGDDGRWVEPGHQFEWAWLLERWGRARGDDRARAAARRLFRHGMTGVDLARGVAVNVLWDDLTVRDASARLWPQTEWLKAALILGEEAQALAAANSLAKYLATPARGAWRDKLKPDGSFVDEPAPASSLYHIWVALSELRAYVS
jgi:mannose-6-phosphate isomerase